MKILKTPYIILILIILMVVRRYGTGPWMGSVMLGGLLVAWLDIMSMTWDSTRNISKIREKSKALVIIVVMGIVGGLILSFLVLNLICPFEWLNAPICLDEITLLALLLCLIRDSIVNILIQFVKK